MLIPPAPIFVEDILATSTIDDPVIVDCLPRGPQDRPVGYGWLRWDFIQPGLQIHAADYAAFEDYAIHAGLQQGLFVGINLGCLQVSEANGRLWELQSNGVAVTNLREPIRRKNLRAAETQLTRCGVSILDEWLEAGHLEEMELPNLHIRQLLDSHLTPWMSAASPAILDTALRLNACMNASGPLGRLQREAAGLQFLLDVLTSFNDSGKRSLPRASRRDIGRVAQIRDVLDTLAPLDEVVLSDLAKLAGMSVRSLSRHFFAAYGTTISAYVADARMESARRALQRREASVDQAAYMAGFSHRSNFARAFRRRFGVTPGSLVAASRRRGGPAG